MQVPRISKRRLWWICVLTAAGLVAGGASAALVRHLRGAADQPTPSRVDGTYEAVHSTVEATLSFPGSAESQDVGDSSDGQSAAYAGGIYTTDGSSEDVRAWFKNKLEGLGWHSWDGAVRITTMVSVDGYERGNKERYVLAIDDRAQLERELGRRVPAGRTVYETALYVFPASSTFHN